MSCRPSRATTMRGFDRDGSHGPGVCLLSLIVVILLLAADGIHAVIRQRSQQVAVVAGHGILHHGVDFRPGPAFPAGALPPVAQEGEGVPIDADKLTLLHLAVHGHLAPSFLSLTFPSKFRTPFVIWP